jgi:hypothetical protein
MRLTTLEQEFAVWVNARLRLDTEHEINAYARFPAGTLAEAGQRLCGDAAQILGNQAGFRDRRRAFFALCIKGVAGAENWLELLDRGDVQPTVVGIVRRQVNPSPVPKVRPICDEHLDTN